MALGVAQGRKHCSSPVFPFKSAIFLVAVLILCPHHDLSPPPPPFFFFGKNQGKKRPFDCPIGGIYMWFDAVFYPDTKGNQLGRFLLVIPPVNRTVESRGLAGVSARAFVSHPSPLSCNYDVLF